MNDARIQSWLKRCKKSWDKDVKTKNSFRNLCFRKTSAWIMDSDNSQEEFDFWVKCKDHGFPYDTGRMALLCFTVKAGKGQYEHKKTN